MAQSSGVAADGGTEFDLGTASGGTLSGGVQYVYASAAATTIGSGGHEVVYAGGTLKIDGTGSYDLLVAGFAVPDAIDLTAVNYASATLNYSGNTSGGTLTAGDGTNSVSLLLLGNYTAQNFSLGSTGTIVSDPPTTQTTDLNSIAPVAQHRA
jgi:autotransporter passenger strand-loop-strand repeat protein